MPQDVNVRRVLLPAASPEDLNRKLYQIEYQVGELPPGFVYLEEKKWTKEAEAALIQADIKRRMSGAGRETISI